MERKAHYALVGLTTVALFFGVIGFIVWLGNFQINKSYDFYDVVFHGPVRGISEGGEVNFNGIKVGEVTTLNFEAGDPSVVVARIRVASSTPVSVASRAVLEPQGITGVNYIQISAGPKQSPLLKYATPLGKTPQIQTDPSMLANLLNRGGSAVDQAAEALRRFNLALSDENLHALNQTLANVETISSDLSRQQKTLEETQRAMTNIADAAAAFKDTAHTISAWTDGDGKLAAEKVQKAADSTQASSDDFRAMLQKVDGPVTEFAQSGLPELKASIVSLRDTSEQLNRLVMEVRASPQSVLNRPPAKEIEVKK